LEQLVRLSALETEVELEAVGLMLKSAKNGERADAEYRLQCFISRDAWNGEVDVQTSDLNQLERLLSNVEFKRFRISEDGLRILAAGTILDLSRRGPSKRIISALVEAYPDAVDSWTLLDAAWPEATVHDPSILNRLYTTLHRLRQDGLEGLIETSDSGYRLCVEPAPLD